MSALTIAILKETSDIYTHTVCFKRNAALIVIGEAFTRQDLTKSSLKPR